VVDVPRLDVPPLVASPSRVTTKFKFELVTGTLAKVLAVPVMAVTRLEALAVKFSVSLELPPEMVPVSLRPELIVVLEAELPVAIV
jgi:hypothetical protein